MQQLGLSVAYGNRNDTFVSDFLNHVLSIGYIPSDKIDMSWQAIKTSVTTHAIYANNDMIAEFIGVYDLSYNTLFLVPGCKPKGPIESPLCVRASVR